jgi:F0F1-type ATP synthase membrane subunit b/b'
MSEPTATPGGDGALASIRRLEQVLADESATRSTATERLEAARAEAESILDTARRKAAAASDERRRQTLEAANREAAGIHAQAEIAAGRLRETADRTFEATVDAALDLILPRDTRTEG